jgi:hypothetical protein
MHLQTKVFLAGSLAAANASVSKQVAQMKKAGVWGPALVLRLRA